MVRPEIKYFWKNGYTHAIGTTIIIAIAILTLSVGILALYCCNESPPYGLFAIYSILFWILFSIDCNVCKFLSEIYKDA